MKINTNFIKPASRFVMPLSIALLILAVLFLTLAFTCFHHHQALKKNTIAEQKALWIVQDELSQYEEQMQQLPSLSDFQVVRERIESLRPFTGGHYLPLDSVLMILERELSESVTIAALDYRQRGAETHIIIESDQNKPLIDTFSALQSRPEFSRVTLLRKRQGDAARERMYQYEINLKGNRND